LLIFVKETVLVHVENLHEVRSSLNSQEIINNLLILIKDQVDIGFIEDSFFSEVGLSDGMPYILTLSCTPELKKTVIVIFGVLP
jgi:hypothetical protein